VKERQETIKADLRVFGAVGLQDFWLRKHNALSQRRYNSPYCFFQNLLSECMDKEISICGLTTEDDRVYPGLPEDRFGYLKMEIPKLKRTGLKVDETLGEDVLSFTRNGRPIYIINSQTVHPFEGLDVKQQVIGTNKIKNGLKIGEIISYCDQNGLIRFPVNTHSVTTSSAHFLSDIGTSYLEVQREVIDFSSQTNLLDTLSHSLKDAKRVRNHSLIRGLAWKVMLQIWGRNPNRFKDCLSSYNLPQNGNFYNYR